ncbi:hypothetical protein [Gemmatimonas sp.]
MPPLPRQLALTALCDTVADQLLELVHGDPRWALYSAQGLDLPLAVAMAVAERVARFGQGVPCHEVEAIATPAEAPVPVGASAIARPTRLPC